MPERTFKHGLRPQAIRTYLVLFALVLVLPIVALAILALSRMASLEEAETQRRVIQVAEDLAEDIDRELDRAILVLQTLATVDSLRRNDLSAFHAQSVRALKNTKSAIVLVDRSNQQLVDTLKEYGAPLPKTADPVRINAGPRSSKQR